MLRRRTLENIKDYIVNEVPSSADNLGDHNATIRLWMNGNEIQGAGNNTLINGLEVGQIGTGNWFGIANRNRATTSGYALIHHDDGTTLLNAETGLRIGFRIANTEQMTMSAAGNFGIGTTNPNRKLEINSSGASPIRLSQQRANQSPTLGNDAHHVLVVDNAGDVKTKLAGRSYTPNDCGCTAGSRPFILPSNLLEFTLADGNWAGNSQGNTTLADFILPTPVNARAAGHSNGDIVIINRNSGWNVVIGMTNTNLTSNYLVPPGTSVGFILGSQRWYQIF
ncbi:MAG TPA: hypothetical protein DDE71_05360 [Tenacibaculum sp.]|nr:hypothetical protein [Tenacibaculum sp.]